ncbi:MAG: amidohydrolase family protein [Paracoccus sp. (in: a-proteobacteria)]
MVIHCTVVEKERVEASHPMRAWVGAGLNPSASTDCPVTEIDPMPVIYNMVTRKTSEGTELGADQVLSMEEALHAYTQASAYAARQERIKGTLQPGQLGDVAVWSRDLFAIAPDDILNTQCDLTVLGGRVVHRRAGA